MITKFLKWLLGANEPENEGILYDEETDRMIDEQNKSREMFEETVGESPFEQIDWILENGLDKFTELQGKSESGELVREQERQVAQEGHDFLKTAMERKGYRIYSNNHNFFDQVGIVRGNLNNEIEKLEVIHKENSLHNDRLSEKIDRFKDEIDSHRRELEYLEHRHGNGLLINFTHPREKPREKFTLTGGYIISTTKECFYDEEVVEIMSIKCNACRLTTRIGTRENMNTGREDRFVMKCKYCRNFLGTIEKEYS